MGIKVLSPLLDLQTSCKHDTHFSDDFTLKNVNSDEQ